MPRDQYTFGHTADWRREDNGQGTIVQHLVRINGTVTMGELAAELERLDAPDNVYISNGHITWDAEATLEKIQQREGNIRAQIERTRAWEIETLRRLQSKYPEIEAPVGTYVEDPLA